MLTRSKTYPLILSAATIAATAGLSEPAAAQNVTDANTTNHIAGEYVVRDEVDAYRVSVETNDGHVTLTGTVNNLLEKRQAEDIALATVGVTSVTNNVEVRKSDRSSGKIRTDAVKALLLDPAADSYEIDVAVKNGTVTLTGTVNSYAEKNLAETVVAGVKGVREVKNDVMIEYDFERPDREIRADISQRLAHTVSVEDALLDVSVTSGDVVLSGTVGSAAEKWDAHNLAWVAGVDSVDVSGVDIEWWARDNMRRTDLFSSMTDATVRDAVGSAYMFSPLVNSQNVTVTANNGIVTLTGKVDDLRAKRTAETLAETTVGVWSVNNYLRVATPPLVTDERLEADLREALLRDAYVDRFDMTVSVINGHAHLYGDVDTEFEKARAENAAVAIDGVADVSNYLTISDEWTPQDDWEIAEDIASELFWSPFVDSDEVTVVVVDGVATLTGTVDTLDERAAAVENAYEGGAQLVDNDLLVDNSPDPHLP